MTNHVDMNTLDSGPVFSEENIKSMPVVKYAEVPTDQPVILYLDRGPNILWGVRWADGPGWCRYVYKEQLDASSTD